MTRMRLGCGCYERIGRRGADQCRNEAQQRRSVIGWHIINALVLGLVLFMCCLAIFAYRNMSASLTRVRAWSSLLSSSVSLVCSSVRAGRAVLQKTDVMMTQSTFCTPKILPLPHHSMSFWYDDRIASLHKRLLRWSLWSARLLLAAGVPHVIILFSAEN